MNNYWKNHYNQSTVEFKDSLIKQVGKTVEGIEIDNNQIQLIVTSIVSSMTISQSDAVIDICCGNGLITSQISKFAERIIGVDFSEGLINTAKSFCSEPNVTYINMDILDIQEDIIAGCNKIYMYEGLQHFNQDMFSSLLLKLKSLRGVDEFFIGSVPNKAKLWDYYDTEEKKLFYLRRENENKPHMGKWWEQEEIHNVATDHGYRVTFIDQNPELYTAYYRFNCLLEK